MNKFLRLGLPVIVLAWGMLVVGCGNSSTDEGNARGNGNNPGGGGGKSKDGGFVWVDGGTFTMGSAITETDRRTDETQHEVTLSSFYIGKYPVTQKEWREVMGTNPSFFKGDNLPVEMVSWYDAVEYCNKRSEKEGLTPAYTIDKTKKDPNNAASAGYDAFKWTVTLNNDANGYRLPTEAEWEYAARGGAEESKTYSIYARSDNVDEVAWYRGNSGDKTHPVGMKKPNALGIYDMSGNVWEWCWDWYSDSYPAAATDPAGASSGSGRVWRGGSWNDSANYVRSASRYRLWPPSQSEDLGFRLVRP